jgi:hypothetical protein
MLPVAVVRTFSLFLLLSFPSSLFPFFSLYLTILHLMLSAIAFVCYMVPIVIITITVITITITIIPPLILPPLPAPHALGDCLSWVHGVNGDREDRRKTAGQEHGLPRTGQQTGDLIT